MELGRLRPLVSVKGAMSSGWDEGQASVGLKEDGRRAKENSPLVEDIASIGEQRNGVAMKGDTGLRLALFFKMTEVALGYRRLVEKEDDIAGQGTQAAAKCARTRGEGGCTWEHRPLQKLHFLKKFITFQHR